MSAHSTSEVSRLQQVLRLQVSRSSPESEPLVFAGEPLSRQEVEQLEANGLIAWAKLGGSASEEFAWLTFEGEERLAELNRAAPPASGRASAIDTMLSLRGALKRRQRRYWQDLEAAVQSRQWGQASGLDGIATGLLMAERELQSRIESVLAQQHNDVGANGPASDRPASPSQTAPALPPTKAVGAWPEAWKNTGYNGCLPDAQEALRHLSSGNRSVGGQSRFNAEHLLQIAAELELTRRAFASMTANEPAKPADVRPTAEPSAQVSVPLATLMAAINPDAGAEVCAHNGPRGSESHDCTGCGARNPDGWGEPIRHKPGCSYVAQRTALAELRQLVQAAPK